MAGLVPAIYVLLSCATIKAWMPGTSPGMTKQADVTQKKPRQNRGFRYDIPKMPADQRE
jgi:hypothetical protein